MRALVSRPDPPYVELAVVSDPGPDRDQALVEVKALAPASLASWIATVD